MILGGGAMLALGLAYAELLRVYGTPGVVQWLFDAADWSQENLGAVPRPMQALLGIPMLVWGVHMRARRRQGWWACAFGVTGMVPIAHVLADPALGLTEVVLTEVYSLVVGLVLGRAADPGRPARQRLGGPPREPARGGERGAPRGRAHPTAALTPLRGPGRGGGIRTRG